MAVVRIGEIVRRVLTGMRGLRANLTPLLAKEIDANSLVELMVKVSQVTETMRQSKLKLDKGKLSEGVLQTALGLEISPAPNPREILNVFKKSKEVKKCFDKDVWPLFEGKVYNLESGNVVRNSVKLPVGFTKKVEEALDALKQFTEE